MRRLIAVITLLLILGTALAGVVRLLWLNELDKDQEESAKQIASVVGPDLEAGRNIDSKLYQRFVNANPAIGYLVAVGYRSEYRSGSINASRLQAGSQNLVDFLRVRGDADTLSRLTQGDSGFPGPYLNVVSATLLPHESERDRTPVGMVKVGFVLPGYPFGRGFENLVWALGATAGVGILALLVFAYGHPQQPPEWHRTGGVQFRGMPITGLDSSDEELNALTEAMLDDDTTNVVDEYGRQWKILFDGKSLEGWKTQGDWYITEREIAGQPWGGSLINETVSSNGSYYFQFRAKKMAGPDGFIALFECDGKSLAWVIGGWRNTRSELAGYEKTRSELTIDRFRWYKVEVRVETDKIDALLDEQLVWSLPRSEIREPSPTKEFQRGVGFAIWSTLCKFKETRFVALSFLDGGVQQSGSFQ
jgi:hypothetical protein